MGRPVKKSTLTHMLAQMWPFSVNAPTFGHVRRQTSNNRFEVLTNGLNRGVCQLSNNVDAPGRMQALAWDNDGGAYSVLHATNTVVTLERLTGTKWANNQDVQYNLRVANSDEVWLQNDSQATLIVPVMPTINSINPVNTAYAYAVANNGDAVYVYSDTTCAWVSLDGSYTQLQLGSYGAISVISGSDADGSIAIGAVIDSGDNHFEPAVWDRQGNLSVLDMGIYPSVVASGCSADGTKIVGRASAGPVFTTMPHLVTWTNGSLDTALPAIPATVISLSSAGCTPDGQIIWVTVEVTGGKRAFSIPAGGSTWTEIPLPVNIGDIRKITNNAGIILFNNGAESGFTSDDQGDHWQQLPTLGTTPFGFAYAMDDAGHTIVGSGDDSASNSWPVLWQTGLIFQLSIIPGGEFITPGYLGSAYVISANGRYIIGDTYDADGDDISVVYVK